MTPNSLLNGTDQHIPIPNLFELFQPVSTIPLQYQQHRMCTIYILRNKSITATYLQASYFQKAIATNF